MVQYAVARNLAHIKQAEFKMDISGFELIEPIDTPRRYELSCFNIVENFASLEEVAALIDRKQGIMGRVIRRVLHKPPKLPPTYIREKKRFRFDHDILNLSDDACLDGYWQNEKYFKDIADVIKDDFTIKIEPDEKNKDLLSQIKNCNAVAIHVRRGDYATNPQTANYHGACGLDYYEKCVDLVAKKMNSPHFFVFSDDPKWTIENLKIDFSTTYISNNGQDKGCEDLRLMKHCKHFIIANSSFSWWGAWLSNNPNKIVLAPKRWFRKEDIDTKDLIPEGWIRI